MRLIEPKEETLTAGEIAQKLTSELGVDVTSHKVGQTAKRLNLDYVEVDLQVRLLTIRQRRYGIKDLPAITSGLAKQDQPTAH